IDLSTKILQSAETAQNTSDLIFSIWLLFGVLTGLFFLLAIAPAKILMECIRQEKRIIVISLGVGAFLLVNAHFAASLWKPMSDLTFLLSSRLLALITPGLVYIDETAKHLGLGHFIVHIAPVCSGFEGIGLVTGFVSIYLYANRDKHRFPHALLLLPIGAIGIWCLNIFRISGLILIGYYGSEEIAVGGFHSQMGWITFLATSFGILWLAGKVPYFNKEEMPRTGADTPGGFLSVPVATLLPLLVLLITTMLTAIFTTNFEWLYPVKALAMAGTLLFVWKSLALPFWRWSYPPLAAGAAVAVMWIVIHGQDVDFSTTFREVLGSAPVWLAILWLCFRFLGSVLLIPITEELAFRGYVLGRISKSGNLISGIIPLSIPAVLISSIAFGALHGAWIAGTIAGIVFACVRLRSDSVVDTIVAHGVAYLIIFIYAAVFGNWFLI
ncbi:MAG: exosortase E/protease, VPEID-CTERM system, partial [Thermodesulfobacteriota bacterium]